MTEHNHRSDEELFEMASRLRQRLTEDTEDLRRLVAELRNRYLNQREVGGDD